MNEGRYLPEILSDLAKAVDKLLDISMKDNISYDDYRELNDLKDLIQYIIDK